MFKPEPTVLLVCMLLGGCAGFDVEESGDLVPTSVVMNSLKCDVAQYLSYERDNRGRPFIIEDGEDIPATLTLNVVDTKSAGGTVDLDPSILTFSGGALGLGFSAGVKRTATTVRKVELKLTPSAKDSAICDAAAGELIEGGLGLRGWLVSTRTDMEKARRGAPLALVDKLTYSTEFAVERKAGGSAKLAFVPIKAGVEASRLRSDIQKIEVVITTKKQPKPRPGRRPRPCDPDIETCPMFRGSQMML
jgi:hypothetical protein